MLRAKKADEVRDLFVVSSGKKSVTNAEVTARLIFHHIRRRFPNLPLQKVSIIKEVLWEKLKERKLRIISPPTLAPNRSKLAVATSILVVYCSKERGL